MSTLSTSNELADAAEQKLRDAQTTEWPKQVEPYVFQYGGELFVGFDPTDGGSSIVGAWRTQKEAHDALNACVEQTITPHAEEFGVVIDNIVSEAMRRYLRVCSSGGMSSKHIKIVQANVDEAERLNYFKLAIAEAILADRERQTTGIQREAYEGWKEAAIAWTVCASIHAQWAKGKDALYKTRHADFLRHAEDARKKCGVTGNQVELRD